MTTVPKTQQTLGGYTSVALLSEADDNLILASDILYIVAFAADMGLRLPAYAALREGTKVHLLLAGDGSRFALRVPAAPALILGEGNGGEGYCLLSGQIERYTITYMGTALGVPGWELVNETRSLAGPSKPPVYWATREPLPSYTASGVDEFLILTADGDGTLFVDGQEVVATPAVAGGVLLKNESGANAQYNGIWQVVQAGVDAVSPFILRKRVDWNHAKSTTLGTSIAVARNGDLGFNGTNSGKTFTTGVGTDVGSHLDTDFRTRSRVEDVQGDDFKTTVNAVTAVVGKIPVFGNDTVSRSRVMVTAQDDTSGARQDYEYLVLIKKDSGGTITVDLIDEKLKFEEQAPATPAVTFFINNPDETVDITVLGIVARTIEWRGQYETSYLPLGGG